MSRTLDETRRRRAVAFVRALARHAGEERACVERAVALMGDDPAVARAAELLSPGRLWAVDQRGRSDLASLRAAYADALRVTSPLAPALSSLERALRAVEGSCGEARDATRDPSGREVSLITSEDRATLEALERDFLSAFCYVVAALYGVKPLSPLVGMKVGSLEQLERVRSVVDRIADDLADKRPLGCWTIARYRDGGTVLPAANGYALEWSDSPLAALDGVHDLRRVSPFLSVARATSSRVVVAGRGNVVGTDPLNSVRLRDQGVVTSLHPSALLQKPVSLGNPIGTLRNALDGDAFCLSPELVALALDRWGHAARRSLP